MAGGRRRPPTRRVGGERGEMDFAGMKRWDLQALCKEHGLPAGGTNAALVARLAACSALQGAAADVGEEVEVAARKGCLKRPAGGNDLGEAKKAVSFALEQSRGRRRRSQVTGLPAVVAVEAPPAGSSDAEVGRGERRRAEAVGASADGDSVAAEVGAAAPLPVRRSRRNSVRLGDVEAVQEHAVSVDRKRKRKSQEEDEETSVRALAEVPRRVTRRSSLSGATLLSPLAMEKKRGREKAADGKNERCADDQVAEAQDFAVVAKVEAPVRVTRSRAVAGTVTEPIVIGKKRRRTTEYDQPEVELPTVLEVPRNDAPVTRALRNRVVQVNNSVVQKSHVGHELENKRLPSRPATRRNQQLASSMEEEGQEQAPPPSKCSPSRRTGRKNSEASIADSETNKSSSVPTETSNAKCEDVEKQALAKEPVRRSTRKSVGSAMLEKGDKDLIAEKGIRPEAHVARAKRKSVVLIENIQDVSEDFQNAKGDDVVKQPAVKEPTRRSTRKSIVSAMLEEEDKNLIAEKSPEAHVRRSKRNSVMPVKDCKGDSEDAQNAQDKDVVKQPAVTKPVRRSTRKSVVSVMLEEGGKNLIAEKSPEAHVRRSKRNSVVPVKDCKGDSEDAQNAKDNDVVQQPEVTKPVRRSTRKSVVSVMLGKNWIAEKSPEAHVMTMKQRSVVPVNDSKGDSNETQNARGVDAAKQLTVKEPVRRSTRKSFASRMLGNYENDLVGAKKPDTLDKRSARKSVLPNDMINKENQDHIIMARNEGDGGDGEKQLKVEGPVRLSRRPVATIVSEKDNKGLHEETKSEIPMNRSTRKCVASNAVEKGDMDHTEMVGWEPSGVGSQNLKARGEITEYDGVMATSEIELQAEVSVQNSPYHSTHKSPNCKLSDDNKTHSGMTKYISCEKPSEEVLKHRKRRKSSVEISSVDNDSYNLVDVEGQKFRNQSNAHTPNEIDSKGTNYEMTTSKGGSTKRKTTVPEEVMSVEEATYDDMVIREAIRDTVTHGNESSSRMEEIRQYNATGEECIVQTIHNVTSGSELADAQNPDIYPSHGRESSDQSKQTQEDYAIQTDDDPLSETRIEELDRSSSITEVLLHNCTVSDDKKLRDGGEVNFGDKSIQIANASSDEVGLETSITAAVLIVDAEAPMVESITTVNAETNQSDAEAAQTVLSCCDGITARQGVSTDASESVPPISGRKQESHNAEQSIQDADMGKCISKSIEGNPLSPNSHSDGAGTDSNLPTLDAAKGSSSDRSHSSFDLGFLFAEELKENSSRNDTSTGVEGDYGSKPSACLTHSFCMRSDCGVECENVQPLGYDAEKTLDVSHVVAQEEFIAAEMSNNEHVAVECDLKTKSNYEAVGLYMESNCTLAENNTRPVAKILDDEQTVIQVQQDAVHEASEYAPPISGSKQESHSAEQSIQDADMGKSISKSIEGNPLSPNPHSDGADTDSILPTLDAAKGSSSDRSRSSIGLGFLFAGERKESSPRNDTSTGVGGDYGSKPSAGLTPSFCMRPDCGVECENVQPLGYDADKTLDVGHNVAQEEFIAAEMSNNEHVTVECDLKIKSNYEAVGLYMESNCTLAENNTRLVAKILDDEQAVIQVQQDAGHEASESAPPISGSKQESHSAEQSIQDADMGKCISKSIEGNPLSPNPHSNGADTDSILPTLDAAKGSSSDRNRSSFGLDFLFAEECKESSSRNDTSTGVEVDYGSKPCACLTPSFCMRPDCGVECENVQPLGYDADKTLDVGHSVAQEFIAAEMSNNEHVTVECDLKTKSNYEAAGLYMESNCTLAENNTRLVAKSFDDEQAVIQVQQDAVQEAPECEHEFSLPEEAKLHSIVNKRCSPSVEQSPLGLQSLFSQESLDDSMEHGFHGALASAISHTESGADQLKDCHVKCTVEATTVSQPISHHDTHLVTGTDEVEGLPEVSHEELVSSSLSGFSVDGNSRKEVTNSAEPTCKGDGNRNILHSEDINASCEKSHVNMSVDGDCGISGTVLSCSLQAPDTDNDDVHLDSNVAQLDSADLSVELIGGSNTEVQQLSQKEHHIEETENQVASRPCTNDIMDAPTSKCIESGVMLLPAEGCENLKDGQLNSKLKGSQAVGSGCNYNKDVSKIIDDGSITSIIGERNSPAFILPMDYPADHYLRHELLDDFSVEKSLEESAMSRGRNVSTAGTVGNPSSDSAMSEHKCVLFEEVEHRMKNYVGTCPSNPKELVMEMKSMSSKENIEESDRDNLALPISGFRGDESSVVEQHINLHSGSIPSYLESNDFMDGSILCSNMEVPHQGHNNRCNGDSTEEQVASKPCTYDTTESINVNYIESEVDLLPVEQRSELQGRQLNSVLESAKVVESSPSSNKDVRDILENESVDIVYEKFLFGDKSDSRVNTTNNSVGTCLSDPRELLMDLESSSEETIEGRNSHDNIAFLNSEREADESTLCDVENLDDTAVSSEPALNPDRSQDFSIDRGKQGCTFGLDKKLLEDCYLDSCQKHYSPDVLCVSQCPEESTYCQDECVLGPGTCYSSGEKCTDESINKQWTSHTLALDCGVPEAASIARSRRVTGMVSAAGTSELPDEQLNTKPEGPQIQEHNCVVDKDTHSLFDAELVGKSKASKLPQDAQWNSSSEHNLPTDLSAPRSPEKSTTFQNDNVSGSVGSCPSSRRRPMDEIITKLQKFKVSSAVKGSFIGISASCPKQGESLSQSAATTLLRNIENMCPVKLDHPVRLNPDRSAAKDSSRRALQPLSGRPRDH